MPSKRKVDDVSQLDTEQLTKRPKTDDTETTTSVPPSTDVPANAVIKPDEMKGEDIENDDGDDTPLYDTKRRERAAATRHCPYLGTIDRAVLDFDFEKLCSVSLSHLNIYACLVCGKYFQGRGPNTHAYTHALDTDHRVYMNLHSLKFYCLPDDYEVVDSALDDIKYVCRPVYTQSDVRSIDRNSRLVRAQDGQNYRPGVMGLNNIKANDYCNAVLQALSVVAPIRDFFLPEANYAAIRRPPGDKLQQLAQRFGELLRKLWNPRAFKTHVSPHEFLQAVVLCSEKRFQITKQGDSIDFLSWLLNALHTSLNGTKKTSSSVISQTFRGHMLAYTRKVLPVDATDQERDRLANTYEYQERTEKVAFLYLTMDMPPPPVHRDEQQGNIIPQVPLATLLNKFNGETEKAYNTYNENFIKRFTLIDLPPYLIIYYKRFHENRYFLEKNPTIVNFPIKNVDLYELLDERSRAAHQYTTYDLIANVVHDGKPQSGMGAYRVQILHNSTNKWYELEDLHVKEILPQIITLTESYIQIWRLNRSKTREQRAGEQQEDAIVEDVITS